MRLPNLLAALGATAALATPVLAQGINLPPADLAPGESYRVLCVTDGARDATSTDIAVYNAFVDADANANPLLASLDTEWRAVASTAAVMARDNTSSYPTSPGDPGLPIYRPDGVRLADDYLAFWNSNPASMLFAPPQITTTGEQLFGNVRVWTGSFSDGLPHPTFPLGGAATIVGETNLAGNGWIQGGGLGSALDNRLYAMSGVLTVPEPVPAPADLPPGAPYRILTVTDGMRNALSSDIDDYNRFVADDVRLNGDLVQLGAEWRALASTSSVSARDNTGTDATAPGVQGVPIYLVDGTRIANDYDDLWDGSLSTSPNVTGSGGAPSGGFVWTGSNTDGSAAGMLALGGFGSSILGDPSATGATWFSNFLLNGAANFPLYGLSSVLTKPIPAAADVTGVSCDVGPIDGPVQSISWVPNGSGGFTVTSGSGVAYDAANLGAEIATDDDILTTVDLGWAFPWLGGTPSASLDIDSNGKIAPPGSFSDDDAVSAVAAFLGTSISRPFTGPGLAAFWTDLDPGDASAPGALDQIRFFTDGVGAANITWLEVNQFGGDEPLTFQIQLEASGTIHVVYRSVSRFDPGAGAWGNLLIGYSAAPGIAVGESDLFAGSIDTGITPTAYEFWHRTDVDMQDIQGPGGDVFLTLAADTLPVLGGVLELTAVDMPISGTSASILAAGLVPIAPIPFSLIDADNPCVLTTNADLFTLFAPIGAATHTFVQDFTALVDPALAGTTIDYQVISVSDTFPFFTTDPSGDGSFPFATVERDPGGAGRLASVAVQRCQAPLHRSRLAGLPDFPAEAEKSLPPFRGTDVGRVNPTRSLGEHSRCVFQPSSRPRSP